MPKKSKGKAPANTPHLIVSEPISLLERDLKADARGFFKALGKGIGHFGSGKVWELAGDTSEALAAIGLKTDPGGLTWLLISRSLQRAMLTLIDEAWLHRVENAPPPSNELVERLDKEVSKTKLEVDKAFFRQPGNLPFVAHSAAWFEEWLSAAGFDRPKAVSISSRLRSYFVYALNQEWRAHPELYAPIINAATTPFSQAGERERAWDQYESWLGQELDGPMFGEPFSLRQLYIPLRAYYHRSPTDIKEATTTRPDEKDRKRIAVDLTKAVIEWVKQKDRQDTVRVISGGPGAGKSSVAKMLTAEVLAHTPWHALYIPLHRIKYKSEVAPAIHDYLSLTELLPGDNTPLDTVNGEPQLLLIFDGLDELAMQGKMAHGTAMEFVRAVKDLVRDRNTTKLGLKAILTGRTVVMQGLESEFRREGAVLHLVPYFVTATPEEKKRYKQGADLLIADQRQEWWCKYGAVTGRNYQGLPAHFNKDNLVEVSSEPLLNYLLALAEQAGTLDFTQEVTENDIYAGLIHQVYERPWSDGQHFTVQGMTEDHFQRVLEEIAVAAWHGDGRKTTIGEIKQHCDASNISRMLEIFHDSAENGVLRLLTAFFFRRAGERNDSDAFEFTHKSFGEYLVSLRIVRLLKDIADETERQRTRFTGWDERTCLEKWSRLCGPTALNARQWGFLKNEMHRESANPNDWQPLLCSLVTHLLRKGMPMERLGLPDYLTMRTQSRNAEETLLVTLNACALVVKRVSNIDWPEKTSFGTWLKHLQEQRLDEAPALAMHSWGWLLLDGQLLHGVDFYASSLSGSSMQGISAPTATFLDAKLEGVNFHGATLGEANLNRADLTAANLVDANLVGATFVRADLTGADLSGANLSGADLTQAQLGDANFTGAELDGTKGLPSHLQPKQKEGA